MQCKLCKNNEANQTGSHLFSAFFVESMLGKRDEETGHLITGSPDLDYRKDVGAEPIKEDYILCRGCEQRLSYLEGYISQEFTQKINKQRYSENFPTEQVENLEVKSALRTNTKAFKLIIYSILWRACLTDKPLFKSFLLPDEVMESLRESLDKLLPPYENHKVKMKRPVWLKSIDADDQFPDYPFIIIKGLTSEDENNRNSTFLHPNFNQPYHLLLNEYLILFFPTSSNGKIEDDFFSLREEYKQLEDQKISSDNIVRIVEFDNDQWNRIIRTLKDALVKQKLGAIYKQIGFEFFRSNGRFPNELELKELVGSYLHSQEDEE